MATGSHPSIEDRAHAFVALHKGPGIFVIPNPWDVGTALILEQLGFKALATTSAGFAHTMGRRDGSITRDEALNHARDIVEASALPVSADLENGFGHAPKDAAATIRGAGEVGLAGASIEDYSGDAAKPIYDRTHAAERIAAAAEAARSLGRPFVLTARAENYLRGNPDLDDTIARLQAFEKAGADVLYAPGLSTIEEITNVCRSVTRPVNVIMGRRGPSPTVAELAAVGVRRISVGSAFSRAAMGAFLRAAREVKDHGTFSFGRDAAPNAEVEGFFAETR